ncbi:MAG: hypothetical protein HC855_14170, partial [Rhizobiales bacterium]|nr:hypothetical protein [Hyphomicrobiales bacterium]
MAAALLAIPAEAKCTNFKKQYNACSTTSEKKIVNKKKKTLNYASVKKSKKVAKVKKNRTYAQAKSKKKFYASAKKKGKVYASKKKRLNRQIARSGKGGNPRVVALIKRMAPQYGVPTWFALGRIAKDG